MADHQPSGDIAIDAVETWTRIGARHRLRDEAFLRTMECFLRPGPILELGAATGHLSEILRQRGYDVTASDIAPHFVAAIAARGLAAKQVDATQDIEAQAGGKFDNIVAQGIPPLLHRDPDTHKTTLRMLHAALEPTGRAICMSAIVRDSKAARGYFHPLEQVELARCSGLFRVVTAFPHQVVPTGLYRRWNAALLNLLDFQVAKIAANRWVWVLEKIG